VTLKQDLKNQARRLGFPLAGVTIPQPPAHFSTYERWLEAGNHGKMHYLDNARARAHRANPLLILSECKSILVLIAPYSDPNFAETFEESEPAGRVASYAWGTDYHDILPTKLQTLVTYIEKQVGYPVPHRYYTDTGPLLERDLAQQAGLGWIGKNTCLINPKHGSYFFLAEVLLGLELEPDQPFTSDYCGTCTRCIEACPTECITEDRTIVARCCISYLTIELKEKIPAELRSKMGAWVFGCDICQMVCPWNRFATQNIDAAFSPRPGVPNPNLIQELNLLPEAFNIKFKGSPIKRTKRRGYLRNTAVALGNSKNPISLLALEKVLKDTEPMVREHAIWAINRIKNTE